MVVSVTFWTFFPRLFPISLETFLTCRMPILGKFFHFPFSKWKKKKESLLDIRSTSTEQLTVVLINTQNDTD